MLEKKQSLNDHIIQSYSRITELRLMNCMSWCFCRNEENQHQQCAGFLKLTAGEVNKILSRKIVSASISGSVYAILLGVITPNPFGETIDTIPNYILLISSATPIYLMYSFPVILIYGVLTSIISDELAKLISLKIGNEKSELIISGILHVIFGLVLLMYSLIASIIFFIIDRVLRKKNKEYKWQHALKSLAIPIIVFLIFMGIVWIGHILNEW